MYLLNYEGQEAKGWLNDYLDRAEKQDCRNEDLAIITFKSDAKGASKTWISNMVPHAQIEQTVGKKKLPPGTSKPYDELFAINNTFARMRLDMNILAMKTWSTTKSI